MGVGGMEVGDDEHLWWWWWFKGNWSEDAGWPEDVENVCKYFTCRLHSVVLPVFVQTLYFYFASNLRFSGRSLVSSLLNNQEQKISLWHDYLPALFVTELMQTAGHRMAALMVMFLWLSNVDFYQWSVYASGNIISLVYCVQVSLAKILLLIASCSIIPCKCSWILIKCWRLLTEWLPVFICTLWNIMSQWLWSSTFLHCDLFCVAPREWRCGRGSRLRSLPSCPTLWPKHRVPWRYSACWLFIHTGFGLDRTWEQEWGVGVGWGLGSSLQHSG